MGEMGKGEMGTAHAGKPPSLPRELRTPLVEFSIFLNQIVYMNNTSKKPYSCLFVYVDYGIVVVFVVLHFLLVMIIYPNFYMFLYI
jgi:hypothetical protein